MTATNGYKRLHGLTIAQLNAVDRLVAGDTDQQAADAIGVNRVTVSKWRLYDPTFQAALNERRQHVFGSAVDKLRSLTHKALDTLAAAMDEGNVLAAVTILKAAALDKLPPPAGPTEPEQVLIALVDARLKEKRAARERLRTTDDMLNEIVNPAALAQWEADNTAATWTEVEAELAAQLNGDAHHADTAAAPATAWLGALTWRHCTRATAVNGDAITACADCRCLNAPTILAPPSRRPPDAPPAEFVRTAAGFSLPRAIVHRRPTRPTRIRQDLTVASGSAY